MSRREFGTMVGTAAVVGSGATSHATVQAPAHSTITGREIIERIRANVGVEWKSETVDTLEAGDPSMPVTGVVTTSVATLAVLQQAVKLRANFIVTAEPTFYSRSDARNPTPGARVGSPDGADPATDPVFSAKTDFIDTRRLVVFRLSDHWRLRTPDPRVTGLATALGWPRIEGNVASARFDLPSATLGALARQVKADLDIRGGMRVVGDPQTPIRRVGLLPGSTSIQAALDMLPDVDVIIAGEVREWESVEYVRDAAFSTGRKGLILLGRIVSEEPGMRACATWLQALLPQVPVRHVGAGDPYWRPA